MRARLLLLTVVAVLAGDHAQAQQQPLTLTAGTGDTGYIDLRLRSAPGVAVTISEGTEPVAELTPSGSSTALRRAAQWRCDRRMRTFTATSADGQTASTEVRTPSCARRLAVKAPRRARSGRSAPCG